MNDTLARYELNLDGLTEVAFERGALNFRTKVIRFLGNKGLHALACEVATLALPTNALAPKRREVLEAIEKETGR